MEAFVTAAAERLVGPVRAILPQGCNIALLCLFAAVALCYVPHVIKVIRFGAVVKGGLAKYDLRDPRAAMAKALEKEGATDAGRALARAQSCHGTWCAEGTGSASIQALTISPDIRICVACPHLKSASLLASRLLLRALAKYLPWGFPANQLEGFPIFAAAVLAALYAGVPAAQVDALAVFYVVGRALYTVVFLINTNVVLASTRSVIWLNCMAACAILMLRAAFAGAAPKA